MFWTILLVGISAYLAWLFISRSRACAYNTLDELPGPPKIPILGNGLQFFAKTQAQIFLLARQFKKEYGNRYVIKVLGRRILHISHPNDIELLLSHPKNISKSKPYKFLRPWLGEGLLLSKGGKWHSRRKILTPAFHFNILRNFAAIIEEKARGLVEGLRGRGRELDVELMPVVSDFTLNTICETAMGTQLDVDKSNASVQYKNAILKIGDALYGRLTRLWLHPDAIFRLSARGRTFKEHLATVHTFADNVIMERKKNTESGGDVATKALDGEVFGGKKRLAMLDLLLAAEKKKEIDLEGIREEVNTFMFEGHDTTAMAITFGLMELAKHRDVQDKMHKEYQVVFGESDRTPTMSDLAELKYTEAVIKEILRLYPSVPFIAREISEDFYMGDLLVTAGSEVAIHIYDLHRREDLYPEPEAFKPERFMDASISRHPYAYIPFSAGPRNCIGQRFAMQEMKCVFSEIVRGFILESVMESPRMLADLVLRPVGPITVKFIRR